MTKKNLALIGLAAVAIALLAGNGRLITGLFGPRAMLDVSAGQGQQHAAVPSSGTSANPQTLPSSGPAAAAAKATTSVSITPDTRADRGYLVDARLVTKEGKPIANALVRFYDVVELLGPREMLIGAETTDGLGTVSMFYKPAQGGTHQIIARPANAELAATDGRTTFDATVVAPPAYARERLPLDRFSVNLPAAGQTILLVVWGTFAFVLIGSLIRIPRGAHPDTRSTRRAREI